ncbi:Repressible alkaline phosphatase [Ceratocystis fimbriata CBS 114723]|uniref:Alkaline phosphatase n=1 Tax=Ceratocystis fimbriata CBS 114723 TaxID=1035309 RepID=A0A2C5X232_9PEZI|nr:Repressible alkaline phosphatase [Ceratocystis fimbriata CBS 114723]
MNPETESLLPSGHRDDPDEPTPNDPPAVRFLQTKSRFRDIKMFIWALLVTALLVITAVWTQNPHHHHDISGPTPNNPVTGKRNLIFMVSDGMGPASLSMTRSFRQYIKGESFDKALYIDHRLTGTSRTRSSNSLVTDSAAGATAFSCAQKSYNGAISVLPDHSPCGTILEAAKRAGYLTGLVVTTDITDATPACFSSHVQTRAEMDEIAAQQIGLGPLGRSVDLIFGGGRCHFLPTSKGGCRADDKDLIANATKDLGWNYAGDREAFDKMRRGENVDLPMLGLFADRDIPFELDRRNEATVYPSLSEMTVFALRALEKASKSNEKGFFLMIEGSRIDHAGHINDPAAQVYEVMEYDRSFQGASEFLMISQDEGALVATSDHETGGLATAIQEPGQLPVYNWYPAALAAVTMSSERLASMLQEHISSDEFQTQSRHDLKAWINETLVFGGLGVNDATQDELNDLVDNPDASINTFAAIISLRAHIGWSTHGHTAVDVNIYTSGGANTSALQGDVENTDVGKFLQDYLDVNVDDVTKDLRKAFKFDESEAVNMEGQDDIIQKGTQAAMDAMQRWVPGLSV